MFFELVIWNLVENIWDLFNGIIYFVFLDGLYCNIVKFDYKKLKFFIVFLDLVGKRCIYK